MSLKQQNTVQATFSMSSMTDVIFLLLIFFMVTSTFVFPTGMDINLPESSEQSTIKPSTRVFIDSIGNITASYADADPMPFKPTELAEYLKISLMQDSTQQSVAIYADENVRYAKIVEVLNIGATNGIKMVLATRPTAASETETETSEPVSEPTVPVAPSAELATKIPSTTKSLNNPTTVNR